MSEIIKVKPVVEAIASLPHQAWTKVQLDNIVGPSVQDMFMGACFQVSVKNKDEEIPFVPPMESSVVFRILNHRLLKNGKFDIYVWDEQKVEKEAKKGFKTLGLHSNNIDEIKNFVNVCSKLSEADQEEFIKFFSLHNVSFRIITTLPENREIVKIDAETLAILKEKRVSSVVNDWEYAALTDEAEGLATPLKEGDFLVKTGKGYYVIQEEEFLETHIPGHNA